MEIKTNNKYRDADNNTISPKVGKAETQGKHHVHNHHFPVGKQSHVECNRASLQAGCDIEMIKQ